MKMVVVVYNEAIESEVTDALKELGAANYTKFVDVQGRGGSSGPHLGTTIWPKKNHVLLMAVDDDVAGRILEAIRRLRATAGNEGVKGFVLHLEDIT